MAILRARLYLQYLFDGAFERARQVGWWIDFDQPGDGRIVVVANYLGQETQVFDSTKAKSVASFRGVASWFERCNHILCGQLSHSTAS